MTIFHHLPPLLAFEWSGGVRPDLPETITITPSDSQQAFALRGVMHYGQFHDGMVTGHVLTLQPLQQQHLNTAICVVYNQLTIT